MKKIILSVLALGLSMGLMAQKAMVSSVNLDGTQTLTAVKAKATQAPKATSTYYPEAFNDCASLEEPLMYTFDYEGYTLYVTGSGMFGGVAQGYALSSAVQVKGAEIFMMNGYPEGDEAEPDVVLMNADLSSELAVSSYSTADAGLEGFAPVTVNFANPQTVSSFAIAVYFPEYTQTSTDIIVATTEAGCSSGNDNYLLYNGEWTSPADLFDGFDVDMFIFPIIEGSVGLTEAEVNSLSYVFPNPAKDEVMVASSLNMERVEIVNMLGQVVYSADVNANSVKVNTAEMGAGNYLVKMYTEAGMATKKLVVE
ncbi:MAG: T9SS type A sorting domain-containing protein [Bacteroidales bacterium]|nr:T9SS type A sorting domain-containing protein [Bacteroidales bacterium]